MKHLKLFEEIGLGDEELYEEISSQTFYDLVLGNDAVVEQFTKGEFEKISKLTKSLYNGDWDCMIHKHISSTNGFDTNPRTTENAAIYIGVNEDIIVFKLSDEWYIVHSEITDTDYKCDQWDGLEQCLIDIEF